MKQKLLFITVLLLLIFNKDGSSQHLSLDTNTIVIRTQFNVEILCEFSEEEEYNWPNFNTGPIWDNFYVFASSEKNIIKKDSTIIISQSIILTSFDTGQFYIPEIIFNDHKWTDSILITVISNRDSSADIMNIEIIENKNINEENQNINQRREVFTQPVFINENLSGTIKLFDNGETSFTPFEQEIIDAYFLSIQDSLIADTMEIFKKDWNTTKVNPYEKIDLSKMTDSVIINLRGYSFYCSASGKLNSAFGPRRGRQHKGIDTDLNIGDTIRATFDGKVRYARYNNSGFGNLVIIRHFNGLETYYAHQSKILVAANDMIKAGEPLGLGGETGNALGPHLHYEIRYLDNAFDPEKIINLSNQSLISEKIMLTKDDFKWIKQWRQRKYHKIKSGETLSHLAHKYGTSVKKILKINSGLKTTSVLQIGQKIRVR
tara:strand:+ start:280 stop:1575 length:1296 start_codon:yes stop_codon:yes gene_type:complete